MATPAHGAPGSDGVTFTAIAAAGVEEWLADRRDALVTRPDRPRRTRRVAIPPGGGTVRVRGMPAIRDRVVQGARTRILAPIVAADVHDGSCGCRPTRTAPQAVDRVADASVRHTLRLAPVAHRVHDREVLHGLPRILHAAGTRGLPQGGVRSPRLSTLYLTAVDALLERAKAVTRNGAHTSVGDVRAADDLGILVHHDRWQDWRMRAVGRRLREELATRDVQLHEEQSWIVDLSRGERFGCVGFDFRRVRSLRGRWRPQDTPQPKARTAWLQERKAVCRRARSQPVDRVIAAINPRRRGWGHDFRIGHASRCVACVRWGGERSIRRHLRRARHRRGFGWQRWCTAWRHTTLGWFGESRVRHLVRA